jgi:hypothetical protein
MQNVPNIVRERLRAAESGVDHPDADLLTAFAERSLADRERAMVVEHLARCGDCRDTVAFALPASQHDEVAILPSPRGWFTWPALRWGFAIAGIVIVGTLGIVEVRHQTPSGQNAQNLTIAQESGDKDVAAYSQTQPPAAASPASQPKDAAVAGQVTPQELRDRKAVRTLTPRLTAPNSDPPAPQHQMMARAVPPAGNAFHGGATGRSVTGAPAFGPKMPSLGQQQQGVAGGQSYSAQSYPAPSSTTTKQNADIANNVPTASQTVEVSAAAPAMGVESQELEARSVSPANVRVSNDEAYSLSKAKPAMTTGVSGASSATRGLGTSASLPRWTISVSGGLQRSLDQGTTWQDVDVAASADSSNGDVGLASASEKRYSAVAKQKKQAGALTFRAVAATGPDVWAGGSAGTLYHSLDAGGHWARVVPSAAGTVLTGDIVSLEFADAQHGKITTSAPEVWLTSDEGQTWQRQ